GCAARAGRVQRRGGPTADERVDPEQGEEAQTDDPGALRRRAHRVRHRLSPQQMVRRHSPGALPPPAGSHGNNPFAADSSRPARGMARLAYALHPDTPRLGWAVVRCSESVEGACLSPRPCYDTATGETGRSAVGGDGGRG